MTNIDDKVLQHCLIPRRFLGYIEFNDGHKGWWFDSDWVWMAVLRHSYCRDVDVILLS